MARYYNRLRGSGSKYHSKKVEFEGMTFDSKREARRYLELKGMQEAGLITDLKRQVKYILIPAQREQSTVGARGAIKQGKLIERECSYLADFVYKVVETGQVVVEDTKGMRLKDYIIKRKLMLFVYGIQIKEI